MIHRKLPVAVVLTLCAAAIACAGTSPLGTGTASPTPGVTAASSPVHSPSATIRVQPPTDWPISLTGPWLVYLAEDGLVVANPDGTGRAVLVDGERLGPARFYDFQTVAAPSGARLAVYTFDDPDVLGGPALRIVHVPDGLAPWSTPLLSRSIEAGLAEGPGSGPAAASQALMLDRSLAWSPDGRRLAFVAALDGPSSDLYVYDLDETRQRRVTSGPNQIAGLSWSPDGAWIAHQAVEGFGSGAGWQMGSVWTVSPDGRHLNKLYEPNSGGEVFVGWSKGDSLISYSFRADGNRDLRASGADGAVDTVLVPSGFSDVAYDPESGVVALASAQALSSSGAEPGAFLWDVIRREPRRVDPGDWSTVEWSEAAGRFYFEGASGVIGVTPDGAAVSDPALDRVAPSPDGQYAVLWGDGYGNRRPGIHLYTSDLEFVKTLEDFDVSVVSWRPDSAGVMAMAEAGLTYYPLDGAPQLIDPSAMPTIEGGLGWVLP